MNSVRKRLDSIAKFIDLIKPDILCLQETKVTNDLFPANYFYDLGYDYIFYNGEKSYNGVAIIAKIPLAKQKTIQFGGHESARHISAEIKIKQNIIDLHNFYIPAGGDEPDPVTNNKFAHKLQYLDDMYDYFVKQKKQEKQIVILGDFNIAPLPNDVWSHKQLINVVSHTEIEVEKLDKLRQSLNFIDTARFFVPESEKLYSWWSYRNRDWRKSNRGRRLDHIWFTPNLQNNLVANYIFNETRDWDLPSDHCPVITEIEA
ncbi:MAG: exodeoxyribonuclease III [Pseudomonadota bacterium]